MVGGSWELLLKYILPQGRKACQTMQIADILHNTNTSDADSVVKNTITNTRNTEDIERIAQQLVVQLKNPSRLQFYYKVAWHLSEAKIQHNLEMALAGRNPQKLFSWLCTKDMAK